MRTAVHPVVVINWKQRDAFVNEADDLLQLLADTETYANREWWMVRGEGINARLVDDLLLPDDGETFQIKSLTEEKLIKFVKHTLRNALGLALVGSGFRRGIRA